MVATPHFTDGRFVPDTEHIRRLVDELNGVLAVRRLPLRLLPGMEVMLGPSFLEHLDSGRLLTLNDGLYVLVELPTGFSPLGLENFVDQLIERGIRLILAHPEKNHFIQERPNYLFHLIRRFTPGEILVQITGASLWKPWQYLEYRTARTLLRHNLVHLLASDGHRAKNRPPRLLRAVEVAATLVGETRALQMVHDIPLVVLLGKPFPEGWEPLLPRSRRLF